uniref:Uncharacterized protein n=1 Tax=Zeugodacus cucurbitae TaxID=28588 RepID=A0A0A1WVY8_ZEUCU
MDSTTESKMSSTTKSISRTSTMQKSSSSTISTHSSSNKKIITIGAEELLQMPTLAISHNHTADNGEALTTPLNENQDFHKQLRLQYSNDVQPDENLHSTSIAATSFTAQSSTDMKKTSKIDVVSDIVISHSAMSMESTKQLITAASTNSTQTTSALLKSSESVKRDSAKKEINY